MNIYIGFLLSAIAIVGAGWYLSKYADIIAEKTGLGRGFIGLILLAGVTSLPELVTSSTAIMVRNAPDLAVGNIFGSNMFNIFIISILEILILRKPFLHIISKTNLGYVAYIMLATVIATLGISGYSFSIGWVSINAIFILLIYFLAMWFGYNIMKSAPKTDEEEYKDKKLSISLIIFFLLAVIIFFAGKSGTVYADKIATVTGLGRTFIGGLLLAIMTSLPEVITSISSVRLGAYEMVIGNLLGSNLFNLSIIAVVDLLYKKGNVFNHIAKTEIIPADFSLILLVFMMFGIIKNKKAKKRKLQIETVAIFVFYLLGVYVMYKMR